MPTESMPTASSPSTVGNVGESVGSFSEFSWLDDFPELNITNSDDEVRETGDGRIAHFSSGNHHRSSLNRRLLGLEDSGVGRESKEGGE